MCQEAHRLVEADAGRVGERDGGVGVVVPHRPQARKQRSVERAANAQAAMALADVDRHVDGPLEGGALLVRRGVGVPEDGVTLCADQPRQPLQRSSDARLALR